MSAPQHPPDSSVETSAKPLAPRPESADRFTPGTLLAGRYRIVSPLGKGGMGEVYRADDIRLGQPVALKFLPAALAADSDRLERLVDEVRIGRQISHPNVCRLYDIAEADGHHFLVMEYVDGEDLASLLRRIGRLPGDKALQIARGLCAGLAEAHDKGVIHRDLKPANVMIDGHGHARIADFGLAALAQGVAAADLSGTPQYMAPEQLTGEGASLRSDVYSLGLVLHEMLTGKRVFEAKSLNELRALHSDTKPASLSSSVPDVDTAFERVVMRCLARDPKDRPASARVVLASLPGGDALQAALLAGETPSPEMVAAASKVGDLRPTLAWACLIAGLLGLLSIPILGERVNLFLRIPLPKPPEILADRGRDVLTRLGYPEAPTDRAYGFTRDSIFLGHVRKTFPLAAQWEKLRTTRPGPVLFFYRESPRVLVSTSWIPNGPMAPAELGGVWWNEPPMIVPGMTMVFLDPLGRLTRFEAVPQPFDPDPGPGPNPDWSKALVEAGFDPALLQPSGSHWAAPVDSDRRAAWDGALPGQPDVRFHIEAAAYRGRLVYFRMRGPWPPLANVTDSRILVSQAGLTVFALVMGALAAVWSRRNLRLGRGDLRGARRLATFAFANLTLALLVAADHTVWAIAEFSLLVLTFGQALVGTWFLWVFYLALEPFVRRRWPHTLIAWNRLAAGRFRDPLIGRDVLVGALAGMALVLARQLDLASLLLGRAPAVAADLGTPHTPWVMAEVFFLSAFVGAFFSIGFLFILSLLQALVRRAWLARLLTLLLVLAPSFLRGADPLVSTVTSTIVGAVMVFILVRIGLLAFATLLFTQIVLRYGSLTLDWSAWYAGPSFAVLGFFAVLLLASAYTSLGGKPMFGKAMLDD